MIKPCPICNKSSQEAYQPFCSKVCQQKDLLNWLQESYKIPQAQEEEDEKSVPEETNAQT